MRFSTPLVTLAAATAVSLSTASIQAGDCVPAPEPVFSGSISMGYDSAYLFRGGNYGDDAPWAGIDLEVPLNGDVLINCGVWYVNPTSDVVLVNDELDLYSYLVFPVGECWEVSAGGTWFYYAEDNADGGELGLNLSRKFLESWKFTFEYVYDLVAEGSYFGYYLERLTPINDLMELKLETGISHADENYHRVEAAGDRAYAQAGLTVHLSHCMDLNAYVLGNFPYGDLEDLGEKDDIYGGTSVSFSF